MRNNAMHAEHCVTCMLTLISSSCFPSSLLEEEVLYSQLTSVTIVTETTYNSKVIFCRSVSIRVQTGNDIDHTYISGPLGGK